MSCLGNTSKAQIADNKAAISDTADKVSRPPPELIRELLNHSQTARNCVYLKMSPVILCEIRHQRALETKYVATTFPQSGVRTAQTGKPQAMQKKNYSEHLKHQTDFMPCKCSGITKSIENNGLSTSQKELETS